MAFKWTPVNNGDIYRSWSAPGDVVVSKISREEVVQRYGPVATAVCSKCGKEKPAREFVYALPGSASTNYYSGISDVCRSCRMTKRKGKEVQKMDQKKDSPKNESCVEPPDPKSPIASAIEKLKGMYVSEVYTIPNGDHIVLSCSLPEISDSSSIVAAPSSNVALYIPASSSADIFLLDPA